MIQKNDIPDDVLRYLNKYQYTGYVIESSFKYNIKCIVVIPVLAEYDNLILLLDSLKKNDQRYLSKTLFIFVINNTSSADPAVKENNVRSLALLRAIQGNDKTGDIAAERFFSSGLNLGIVDASTEEKALPGRDGGVGFARKIGMDLALNYFDYSAPGKNILVCLDADCRVEDNYLEQIITTFNEKNLSAASINFRHPLEGSEEQQKAICCYEIFLRYYVLGLKSAGSAYAFHTIGSSMACDSLAYIKAEGMNKLKAAEDFYFLEKLAKSNQIGSIESTTVYPSSRPSWRVPFGTGQRVSRFLSHQQNEYVLYDPESFNVLKSWLKVFHSPVLQNSGQYLEEAYKIYPALKLFLENQHFSTSWDRIVQSTKNEIQLNRQKHFWFDGFRTLKLIHYLRDAAFPLINMFEAVDILLTEFSIPVGLRTAGEEVPSLEIQQKYLEILRSMT